MLLLLLLLLSCCYYTTTALTTTISSTRSQKRKLLSLASLSASRDFDFSSQQGWNNFYEQGDEVTEWHSSISFDILLEQYIPRGSSILIIGCGNSKLPKYIYDAYNSDSDDTHICCLDSSQACLDQLQRQFENDDNDNDNDTPNNNVSFVCGDAVELTKTVGVGGASKPKFDIIIDKGLVDALLCGEGWNVPLERLLQESSRILLEKKGSKYLLISYQLPKSTQEFMKQVTCDTLEWSFQRPESNGRVQVSVATKI